MASMGDMPKAAWNVMSQTRKRYAFPFALAICFSDNDLFGPKKRDIGSFKGAEVTSFHVRSTTSRGPTPFSRWPDPVFGRMRKVRD